MKGDRVVVIVEEVAGHDGRFEDTAFISEGPVTMRSWYYLEGDIKVSEGELLVLEETTVPVRGWSDEVEEHPNYYRIVTEEEYDAGT